MSHQPTGIALYDTAADDAAAAVIAAYSTSFGMATRLLGPRVRTHVRNIYALVRVADEIVDGPAVVAESAEVKGTVVAGITLLFTTSAELLHGTLLPL